MADYVKFEQKDIWEENAKLQKDVKFLKILIFFFGLDLCILTYAILKIGGII